MPILDVTPEELDLLIYEVASYLESMYLGEQDLTVINNTEELFTIPSHRFDDWEEAEKRQALGRKLLKKKKGW